VSSEVLLPPLGLIGEAKAGDKAAQGQLLAEHSRYLLAMISRLMGPALSRTLEPTDVLQETMLVAAARFTEFYGETHDEMRTWLAVLARRKLIDLARHNGRLKRAIKGRLSLDDAAAAPAASPSSSSVGESLGDRIAGNDCTASHLASRREMVLRLRDAIEHLDGLEAKVLELRYAEGQSFDRIGQQIGMGRNGVRAIVARALGKLRKDLPEF
jgi:RNA polymerase sigma-70 factor (subfamily 1)